MLLNFAFSEFDADILDVPRLVIDNINSYRKEFEKWLYDKSNKMTYDTKERVFRFRGDAFVYWLNTYVLNESSEKAKLINSQPDSVDLSAKTVWF